MQDIHDIRPPVQVGMDPALLKVALLVLALVLLAAVAFFALRYFWRKRATLKSNLPMLPPPPPLEVALDGLNRLDDLMAADPRLFYFRLTEIIKRFLGRTFDFKAPEMNTQELIPVLKGLVGFDRELFADMREFMIFSDRIKYAGEAPSGSVMKLHLTFARTFVSLVDQKLVVQIEEEKGDGKDGGKESLKNMEVGNHV